MDRRQFLKSLAAVTVAPLATLIPIKYKPEFLFGRYEGVRWIETQSPVMLAWQRQLLIAARKSIKMNQFIGGDLDSLIQSNEAKKGAIIRWRRYG